jgi:hypothetical protein
MIGVNEKKGDSAIEGKSDLSRVAPERCDPLLPRLRISQEIRKGIPGSFTHCIIAPRVNTV